MKRLSLVTGALMIATPLAAQETDGDARNIFKAWQLLDESASDPRKSYIDEHARYGIDITPDGRMWVNLASTGEQDDYAMLIDDILKGNEYGATVWIRGYHKRNPKVRYRTSMTRYSFGCKEPTIYTLNRVTYAADGSVVNSDQFPYYAGSARTIIPGSIGEEWWTFACRKPRP